MAVSEDLKKSMSNPMIWVGLITVLFSGITSYNQIDNNTIYIDAVAANLDDKTAIIEYQDECLDDLKLQLEILKLEIKYLHEND